MSAMYPAGVEAILDGTVKLSDDALRAILTTPAYTYSPEHRVALDVPPATWLSVSGIVGGVTVTGGVVEGGSVTFHAPIDGQLGNAIVIYDALAERLIAYIDEAHGLPVRTNGADIHCVWDAGGIFAVAS